MQIITGKESADAGRVVIRNGITLAYLDQSDTLEESATILETIFDPKKPVMRVLARYEEAMASGKGIDNAIAEVEAGAMADSQYAGSGLGFGCADFGGAPGGGFAISLAPVKNLTK